MSEDSNTKLSTKTPMEISLGSRNSMDISWLSEEERKALLMDYTKGMLDVGKKAQELHLDASVLERTLSDLSDTARKVSENGDSVTITHSQTTKVGRTEILIGNTEQARNGKLSKSQSGATDWTPYYIFAGFLALVLIAALMGS